MRKAFLYSCRLLLNGTLVLSLTWACASRTRPTSHMVYASAALLAAERALAERRAPDAYRRAENYYWKAKEAYGYREFRVAIDNATKARRYAELAEKEAELSVASGRSRGR